ncbi:ABC transporter ATP-binding protein [uncultured Megasphaera sp.]|uniref:ABC transporter ATP-binding protein n=1 Tax=uncultured Megasphaera sp. TaxID=165188 RepID=UPI00259A1FD2|nr:ABC transporter ATP-binding protein [uncultured Megasphaera sp.]
MNKAAAVRAENLTYTIAGKKILDNISLTIEDGSFTAIIGPNGCGKSTLLKALYRNLRYTGGSVFLYGKDIHTYRRREIGRMVAVLTQYHQAPQGCTTRSLVRLGRFARTSFLRSAAADERAVEAALQRTGVAVLADRMVTTLSGGEQQRAWLAMTLAQEPRILLLDEPTTYLDIRHQLDVMKLLRSLHRQLGLTVVVVLHDLNQAMAFAENVVVMAEGQIRAAGTAAAVLTQERLETVFAVTLEEYRSRTGQTALLPSSRQK